MKITMNKITKTLLIISIYLTYFVIYNYGNLTSEILNNLMSLKGAFKNIVPPSLFAGLFLFLTKRNYFYLFLNIYLIFILLVFAHQFAFGYSSSRSILFYALGVMAIACWYIFMQQQLKINKIIITVLSSIAASFIYLVPLFYIVHSLNFGFNLSEIEIFAIYQTNLGEAYEYINDFIQIKYIALFVLTIFMISFTFYQQAKQSTIKINGRLLVIFGIIFSITSWSQRSNFTTHQLVLAGAQKYIKELKLFKETQDKRQTVSIKFGADKNTLGETYIVVIGESLNKKHMRIYDYFRNTTPRLSALNKLGGGVLIFKNIYSNHTHTMPVLSLALTEANQYNQKEYYQSLSIVEVLKQANIETHWLTNQTIYGVWDNLVSVIAKTADNLIAINGFIGAQTATQQYDGALIGKLKTVLSTKTDKNRVIFVHLMGNHGSYISRYPKDDKYHIFKSKLKQGDFGIKAYKNRDMNDYDNSVLYNDFVVSSMLKELQKKEGITGFLYFSDHADDVINKMGHNSGKFTFEMVQIPMLMWFSDEYKNLYPKKYQNLLSRVETLYSNDMLYDTLIGIFDIKTDKYNAKYDFSADDYELKPENALVLHGKKKYTDKNNYIYWQQKNVKYLLKSQQANRIFPHRVNSIGKLHDIWRDGFRAFEVDVLFFENNKFQVGHNQGVMGVGLEQFLQSIDYAKITKVWLDFKNLNQDNYQSALERLEYLHKKYNLKSKFIIESNTQLEFFKEFNNNNWHTSYYMPTGIIVKLLKENNAQKMQNLALKISKQVELQNISAVSFDDRIYSFVKKYLEPKISNNIVYHIWYAPNLYNVNFKNKLLKNKLYLDNRIKTLLATYKSQFNL